MGNNNMNNNNLFNNNNNNNNMITSNKFMNQQYTRATDRRFKVACCNVQIGMPATPSNCYMTDYINNWEEFMFWYLPYGRVITGLASEYNPAFRDRRWKFVVCQL